MKTHHRRRGRHVQGREPVFNKVHRDKRTYKEAFPDSDEVCKYEKKAKIGQGTFGEVFKARDKQTGKMVALKKCLVQSTSEGFPIGLLREMTILRMLKHKNIVNLTQICTTQGSAHLVFDFCEHDLAGLLRNRSVTFTLPQIKGVMQMLLNGLYYVHREQFLHRDLKPGNILVTRDGVLKIADFSLSRDFSPAKVSQENCYTNKVVTLWYRPPELLLGERGYGPPIDMWGVGCIMAEMWTRVPIMQGHTEQQQLNIISQLCGSITPQVWPNVDTKYKLYQNMELPKGKERKLTEHLKSYIKDPYALDLIDMLLVLDPAQRTDCDNALNHDFFWTDPMPSDLRNMLSTHKTSMFEYLGPPRHLSQPSSDHSGNSILTSQAVYDRVF